LGQLPAESEDHYQDRIFTKAPVLSWDNARLHLKVVYDIMFYPLVLQFFRERSKIQFIQKN
jgi:hypothetical protein